MTVRFVEAAKDAAEKLHRLADSQVIKYLFF